MPKLDLTYQLITVDGRDKVLWSDGRVHPVVRGGDGDEGTAGGGSGATGGSGAGGAGGESGSGDDNQNGGAGSDNKSGSSGESGSAENDKAGEGDKKLELTQAELDDMISKRLGRAKSQWETEIKTAADKAKMDDVQRAKAEKEEADRKSADAIAKANQKLVVADAKIAAIDAKVPADRVAAFVKLADLTDVDVDDDGTVDTKALAKAVKKTIDDNPFLTATDGGKGKGASSAEMNGNGGKGQANTLEDAVSARLAG